MTLVISRLETLNFKIQQKKIKKLIIKATTKNKIHFSKLMIYFLWLNYKQIILVKQRMVNKQWLELCVEIKLLNRLPMLNQITNKKNKYIKNLKNTYITRNISKNMIKQPVIDYQLFKICTQTTIIYEN